MSKKIASESFLDIRNKINRLSCITDKYLFKDLIQAIFCINICIDNRSMLETCLALNACLYEHNGRGKKRIRSYDEFSDFFSKVKEICKPTINDDYTIEDFGEVKINCNNTFYKIIVGTGHNNVFACVNLMKSLASFIEKEEELLLVLKYSSNMIEYFSEDNISDGSNIVRFVLPKSNLYYKTKNFFEEEVFKYRLDKISRFIKTENIIEKMHFITNNGITYPVFNSSLLVDLYDTWESELTDEQRVKFINYGVIERVISLFQFDRSNGCEMYVPAKIFLGGSPAEDSNVYTFIARGSKGLIIAINIDDYTEETLKLEIDNIKHLHNSGSLELGEIYDRFDSGRLRGIHVEKDFPISFLLYNSFSNINEFNITLREKNEERIHSALDVINYLNFMDSVDELFEFLTYRFENEVDKIVGFGGNSALFFIWKEQEYIISKGAIKYNILSIGYDTDNSYVLDYFNNELKSYPFISGDYQFNEPFAWKIIELDSNVYEMYSKYGPGYGGIFIPIDRKNYIFQVNNFEFYKHTNYFEKYQQIHNIIADVIVEGVSSLKEIFLRNEDNLNNQIQLMFMPIEYAKTVKPVDFLHEDRVYCYSDCLYYEGKWLIKFVVKDIPKLLNDLKQANDRSVEFKILKEIFLPMLIRRPILNSIFKSKTLILSKKLKKIGVVTKEISYIWNENSENYKPNNYHHQKVGKKVAMLFNLKNIQPGVYIGRDANKAIRSMQKLLIEDFETSVKRISGLSLHIILLDYYALISHNIYMDRVRYVSFQNLDRKKDEKVRNDIIIQREEYRREARSILYLIETNLFLNKESNMEPDRDEVLFVIAYADWIISLSDVADMCYFTEKEAHIKIDDEFRVDIIPNTNDGEIFKIQKRVYNNLDGLNRDEDIDSKNFGKATTSFKEDTGLDFFVLIKLFTYLSIKFNANGVEKIGINIYSASKELLLNDFINKMDLDIDIIDARKYLDYLIINEKQLKTIKGKTDFYLPFGNKNDREYRFDVKPIIKLHDRIIFSPVIIDNLKREWMNGLFDFVLPYRVNLSNTAKAILDWKKAYEDKVVYDLKEVFLKKNFKFVRTNFELMKINRIHPQELGDYDVFAIDEDNKVVWIIECKVIMLVSTFFDMYTQQKRFFYEQKEDEKFQKRIDYLEENLSTVVKQLGYVHFSDYILKPFMCINKVFIPRYKKVMYPIVSYSEMIDIINNLDTEK